MENKLEFYYLHEVGTNEPTQVNDFKYICYKEGNVGTRIKIPNDSATYCMHQSTGKILNWQVDDDVIDIKGTMGVPKASFKKIHDELGFTVWKNILF